MKPEKAWDWERLQLANARFGALLVAIAAMLFAIGYAVGIGFLILSFVGYLAIILVPALLGVLVLGLILALWARKLAWNCGARAATVIAYSSLAVIAATTIAFFAGCLRDTGPSPWPRG